MNLRWFSDFYDSFYGMPAIVPFGLAFFTGFHWADVLMAIACIAMGFNAHFLRRFRLYENRGA